jgi:translocation and assembly module TamB
VNGQVKDFTIDQFSAEVDANQREVEARNIAASKGRTNLNGSVTLTKGSGTNDTFTNAGIAGQVSLRNLDVAEWTKQAGITEPVTGTGSANARLSGTIERPEAAITVDVQNPSVAGEHADRLRANIRYATGIVEIADGIANDASSEIRFAGTYKHEEADWRNGAVTFEASTQNLPSSRIEHAANLDPPISGTLSGRVQGGGDIRSTQFSLTSATADLSARQIMVDGQRIGDGSLRADTRGSDLSIAANGNIRESRVDATGSWRIGNDSPGTAEVRFSRINIATLQDLVMLDRQAPPPTVEGFVEGNATVNVALEKPSEFRAELRLTTVQVNPRENPAPKLGLKPEDVIVRNDQPVVIDVNMQGATIRAARFTGRDTQMDVAGTIPFRSQPGVDLTLRGNIDLVILQLLRPDLQATGKATVNTTIRGSLQNPNVIGQLSVMGASLYLPDLPNSIDNATGTIMFDRNRATIQRLTTETGGGQIAFTGFLEFGQPLVYRLQAQARSVRVRYPQDVSTTFDADLSLNGTSESSTLTGAVMLNRSAFTLSADLGQLLAEASQPTPVESADNEYLQGIQFDIRIQNGATYQVETSLASNIEADVDLRLRGTPSRPVLLGAIAVNRGELQFFGNRYTVDRGDIRFLNPVKIQPTFDMALSTRARGVTVNVNLSGTLPRPNLSYSSDPPLQTQEIIALLAVGRDPTTNQTLSGASVSAQSSFMAAGGSLLGQVASEQVSNRVQRFFGATRVKIDPTLTGVDNLPQARLTFEQQISRDITLTYIVNLNRTQEQVVRFQWDINREWSAVAVRDPNGLFGIDFQLRKRFK